MKRFNVTILILSVTLVVVFISYLMFFQLDTKEKEKKQVYLVMKSLTENTDFWKDIENGARVAAIELGVDVIVEGPQREINIPEQIQLIEDIIKKKPEAIAIAANEFNALKEVCDKAVDAGITVVTYDSDANMEHEHSFVGTNSNEAAKRLGHELGTLLDGQGKVAILSHVKGSFTSIERSEGFRQGLKAFKDISILDEDYYTDNNLEIAYNTTKKILEEYPDINAFFGTNEVTLLGIGQAIRDLGLKDHIIVVGFDMNNDIALMIEQSIIDASMVQKPFSMGYIAIREALEVLAGKKPEQIDTGAIMINKMNMFLPENQKLIVPNVN